MRISEAKVRVGTVVCGVVRASDWGSRAGGTEVATAGATEHWVKGYIQLKGEVQSVLWQSAAAVATVWPLGRDSSGRT